MKRVNIFSVIVFVAISLYGSIAFYYLPLTNFQGDLTRLAELPESLFGWTKKQPDIDPESLVSASWQDADVLVIGDSFSTPLLWQARLTQHGLKVHTETWESMPSICEDFPEWLRNRQFKGHHVVLEVSEYGLEYWLGQNIRCKQENYYPSGISRVSPPSHSLPRDTVGYSGKLSTGIKTQIKVLNYGRLSSQPDFNQWKVSNSINMVRMKNGCELFSHPQCNDVLFPAPNYKWYSDKYNLSRMQTLNERMKDLSSIWIVIPDKLTTYLHPDQPFWDNAEERFHALNSLKVLRQAIQDKKTVDLYPANDSHLSTAGYLILGDAIFQSMQRQTK